MSDSATYVIKSVVWTKTSGSPVTLDGIEEVTIRQNGQVVAHGHDGSLTVTAHFVDNIEGQVTVRSRTGSIFVDTSLQIGDAGGLVITMQKRAKGKGATSGADKVITAAECVVTSSNLAIPSADRSSLDLEFAVSDAENTAPFSFG